jgi:hypothetical protein
MQTAPSGQSSSQIQSQIGRSSSLLGALDAATNWQAFSVLAGTAVIASICAAVFGAVTAFLATKVAALGMLSGLITFIVVVGVALIGFNAAGILLADGVWGRTQRSVTAALLSSATTCHRWVGVLAAEFAFGLVYLLAITLVLFICKIPGIGPLLYAVVLPVGSILSGVVFFAMIYIAMPLAAPAVWANLTVKNVLLALYNIARMKLLNVVVMMILLGMLVTVSAGFVWAVIAIGAMTVVGLSAAILGISGGGISVVMNLFNGSGLDGYTYAMGFGIGLLVLIGATPGMLIGMKGLSIIFKEVFDPVALQSTQAAFDQKTADAAEKMRQKLEESKAANDANNIAVAPIAPVAPVAPAVTKPVCNKCGGIVDPEDAFCEHCGNKIK